MDILYPMNLPDPLRKILEEHPPTHRSRYGLISADQEADRSGRYFLLIRHGNQAAVCFGRYRLDPPGSVRLMDFESMLDLSMTQAVSLMSLDLPAFDEEAPWDVSRLSLPGSIPRLDREDLTREFQSRIVSSEDRSQYWSEDWTPDFYRGQAKLGCIATSYDRGDQVFLMPELQKSYAILDWHDVRADRGVRKILAGDKPDVLNISLEVSPDPMPAIAELRRAWGSETWLTAPYVELMAMLAGEEEKARDPGFRIWGVILRAQDCEDSSAVSLPVAGELGYTIGRTYTSLSGFFHRGRNCWNHFGKLQLHLLARHMERRGIRLWNLGHPYMDYKTRFGARITPRQEFIPRWNRESAGPAVDIAGRTASRDINPG
jgi:hypothetical protein